MSTQGITQPSTASRPPAVAVPDETRPRQVIAPHREGAEALVNLSSEMLKLSRRDGHRADLEQSLVEQLTNGSGIDQLRTLDAAQRAQVEGAWRRSLSEDRLAGLNTRQLHEALNVNGSFATSLQPPATTRGVLAGVRHRVVTAAANTVQSIGAVLTAPLSPWRRATPGTTTACSTNWRTTSRATPTKDRRESAAVA